VDRLVGPDGSVEVEVLPELGGRLHRIRFRGHDLLRTPAAPTVHAREPIFWGAYPMAPWCNRLTPGTYDVDRRRVTIRPNFTDGSALHGEVFDRAWRVVGSGRYAVRGGGNAGWPWPYEVRLAVDARADAVAVTLELANLADERMPGGLGMHPWFRRPVVLAVRADAVYANNLEPADEPTPVTSALDLRALRPLPTGVDATWTGLREPVVELGWPDLALRATMRIDAPATLVCAASPREGDVEADAIEPQTHAPQGLRRLLNTLPDPLVWVAPGETLAMRIDLALRGW
jgi:aldose 1-epimerase